MPNFTASQRALVKIDQFIVGHYLNKNTLKYVCEVTISDKDEKENLELEVIVLRKQDGRFLQDTWRRQYNNNVRNWHLFSEGTEPE